MARPKATLTPQRLREIAWQIGHHYPAAPAGEYCVLRMVHPRLGHVVWSVSRDRCASGSERLFLRLSDVTDIMYDGTNAHLSRDMPIEDFHGSRYVAIDQPGRNYCVEIGILKHDGTFISLNRSVPAYFERERPSGSYRTEGLFVGGEPASAIPVENIFDAPVFERLHREAAWTGKGRGLSVALVHVAIGSDAARAFESCMLAVTGHLKKFQVGVHAFTKTVPLQAFKGVTDIRAVIERVGSGICADLKRRHVRKPFDLVHCHDWASAAAVADVVREMRVPMVATMLSTEHERSAGMQHPLSEDICALETQVVRSAQLVLVSRSSLMQQLVTLYGVPAERVVIVQEFEQHIQRRHESKAGDVRRSLGINADSRVALFAGELSHAAGADILAEALLYVCGKDPRVSFVFAGDGPLRHELEQRVAQGGAWQRCRFLGHVRHDYFEQLLDATDFVVIPARTWQDTGLAHMAIKAGKPVLTTKQAGITGIVHGENGLITYDNPGSIIWGIQELLNNPLNKALMRAAAREKHSSRDAVAARLCTCYCMAVRDARNGRHG